MNAIHHSPKFTNFNSKYETFNNPTFDNNSSFEKFRNPALRKPVQAGQPRVPTSQWAGFGFSDSLPAHLLHSDNNNIGGLNNGVLNGTIIQNRQSSSGMASDEFRSISPGASSSDSCGKLDVWGKSSSGKLNIHEGAKMINKIMHKSGNGGQQLRNGLGSSNGVQHGRQNVRFPDSRLNKSQNNQNAQIRSIQNQNIQNQNIQNQNIQNQNTQIQNIQNLNNQNPNNQNLNNRNQNNQILPQQNNISHQNKSQKTTAAPTLAKVFSDLDLQSIN